MNSAEIGNQQQTPPKAWIFQANPNKYKILDTLQTQTQEYWNLNQHAKNIGVSDRVLIWIAGEEAGIYAFGTVLTSPVVMPDSSAGMPNWYVPSDGAKPKPRVLVRYDKMLLDHPLKKAFLLTDPVLSGLAVIRFPRGTNFPVTQEQWLALLEWLND